MRRKIVICGVDTSCLPRFTAKESANLLVRVKSGDNAAREKFVYGNLRLVLSVVQRYTPRCGSPDDLSVASG